MRSCIFTNDNNTAINLIEHPYTETFAGRDRHEVLFRRMHGYLFDNDIIQNNVIDLGAWIGDNTVPWAKRSVASLSDQKLSDHERSIIYAIDPSKDNCDFIRQMCEHNQISNVKIFQTAISDKVETISTDDDMYHCTFVEGTSGKNKVEAVSLDYLFENKEIENIGYIHLDVEGMEYKVILGAERIISECRPVITFEQHLEIDNYNLILEHLTNRDYVVFLIDEILPGCRPDCRNSIAFPREKFNQDIVDGIHRHLGVQILLPF
jgi:FkbM family methyltransferase